MSGRRASNRIRGPQSALTDFLAANNISAQQIRDSYEQRNRQAEHQNAAETARQAANDVRLRGTADNEDEEEYEDNDDDENDDEAQEQLESQRKRKRNEQKAKPKGKTSSYKNKKNKKPRASGSGSDDDWNDLDDSLGPDMYKKSKPRPGQLENCEICNKRFTVTAYSKTGPDGGLVCGPCGKELAKDDVSSAKKPKRAPPGKSRRKIESNRLDGVGRGPKSLRQLCIEKVADHHLDIEELGDLPDTLLDNLSQIFSKRRVMNTRTVQLFLRPDLETVAIHDAANLEANDLKQIFAVVPHVSTVILRNACQFKDTVLDYMMERATQISHFHLDASNLITNDKWIEFLHAQGPKLNTLKLAWLDAAFDDQAMAAVVNNCSSLTRLKLKACRKLTLASLQLISNLVQLEHLSLELSQLSDSDPEELVHLVTSIGHNFKTLSLEQCGQIDDYVIEAIQTHCPNLTKLRLTDLDQVTDAALTSLFTPPSTVSSLTYVDFSSARDVDNNNPDGPLEEPIGLASQSFKTLMANAGPNLKVLKISSCRHISHDAFWDVFVGNHSLTKKPKNEPKAKKSDPLAPPPLEFPTTYAALKELNISFCNAVDTAILNGIFKCCPNLKKVIAFGCFRIEEVTVPQGVSLVGVPRAQDAIEQFGGALSGGDLSSFFDKLGEIPVAATG